MIRRKSALSVQSLVALGPERLAQLVLDEAGRNAPFRKLVNAALAASKGPEAVAKLIDRRLAALEKARSFIDWDKARAFRDDLRATVETITGELASASAALAVERLLRFITTHEIVFERIDDSSGHVQGVYYDAIEALGTIVEKLASDEADLLPERIMAALGQSSHGYLVDVAEAVASHLPEPSLRRWDRFLLQRETEERKTQKDNAVRAYEFNASQLRAVRQAIAVARNDLDGLIALEKKKPANSRDTIGIAERLLDAGRAKEALVWARKKPATSLRYMSEADLADGVAPHDPTVPRRISVEAAILTALEDIPAAQALRWSAFEESLNADILRDYIAALPDFEEFEVLDRAFAHALSSSRRYQALAFLMEWPRLDLAAHLVIRDQGNWDGGRYCMLPPIAQALEYEYPLAATVIYRALIDNILARARSKAYGHAARYLTRLVALAKDAGSCAAAAKEAGISDHAAYVLSLKAAHGRKSGFWSLVKSV
ncbi:MAG: hypothetical protein EPN45_19450 [Rhizobiaceae bacterium]|nr:MAG: hypothetical protein EPN45_19450 [Rhizobiaceae bacterium]